MSADDGLPGENSRDEAWFRTSRSRIRCQQDAELRQHGRRCKALQDPQRIPRRRPPDPAGDIVIVALLYANVVPVVAQYGDALAGKVIVDISNPFNAAADGLATRDGTSIAQEVAKAARPAPAW